MNKELSIKSNDDLNNAEIRIKGSSVDILFLYFQLVGQLLKQELATPDILKSIINLCKYENKLKTKLSYNEIQKITKEIMKGNK